MKLSKIFAIAILQAAAALAGTDWISSGSDPAYPPDLYFVGTGLSDKSVDAAKANAMVDVRKQISVHVSASTFEELRSEISGNIEASASRSDSRSLLTTSGDLHGIQIAKTEQSGKLWYALAYLDKGIFIKSAKAHIAELKLDEKTNVENAKGDISAGKFGSAFRSLSAARHDIGEILEQRTLLSAAAAPGDAERLEITDADIAKLYEGCVSAAKLEKISGDNQTISVGDVPADPFVVRVSAEGSGISGILIELRDESGKLLMEKISDASGKIEFPLGEKALSSVGTHSYKVIMNLPVSSTLKTILESSAQEFSYTVRSNPANAKIEVNCAADLAQDQALILADAKKLLAKYDILEDSSSGYTVVLDVKGSEAGNVSGLSETHTFVKTAVTLGFSLKNDDGKVLSAFSKTGTGMASSFGKSVASALANLQIKSEIKPFMDKLAGPPKAAAVKRKIAVFPFVSTNSYEMWYSVSGTITDMLITKLINTRKFVVVERTLLDKLLSEKALAQSGVVEDNEAINAAQFAGADLALIGSATIINDHVELDARLVDVAKGTAVCAMSTSGELSGDLRSLADGLVDKISVK